MIRTERLSALLDRIRRKKKAYQFVFGAQGTASYEFLTDIVHFCKLNETCWSADPREHAMYEGRRQVGLHIMNYINLEPEDLAKLFTVTVIQGDDQ